MIRPWTAPLSDPSQALAQRFRDLVPVIATPRSTLRAPRLEDFAAWHSIVGGPRGVHIGGPMAEDEAWSEFCAGLAVWTLRGHGMWTIAGPGDAVLGFVLIGFEPGDQEHELGYLLCEGAEGQGYATEAAAAVRDYALNVLCLPSLAVYVAPDNRRSAAVAARLGAVKDGMIDACDVWRHHPKREA